MIKRYLYSLIRNIRKDIYQSGLNIFGLTIGCAAIIFIATYINYESSFDKFHSKADRIYRIVADVKIGETEVINTDSENPIAIAVKNDLPEVEETTRIYFKRNQVLKAGDNNIIEEKLWYADKNIFDVFSFELLEGDKNTALAQPNSIVVTKAFGKKYFGNISFIGKTIDIGNSGNSYTITGVLKDIPKNSHLRFEELASYNSLPEFNRTGSMDWGNFMGIYTYILLKKNTDFKNFEAKFRKLPSHYYGSMMKASLGITLAEFESQGNFVKHALQPLKEIHLDKTYIDNVFQYGNKQMLYILGAIGMLIIIVACFNFINMATARASLKAKEIGMKKVLGSSKQAIIFQALSETFIQCLLALTISAIILLIVLPFLNSLTGLTLTSIDFIKLPVIYIFILLPFIISLLAGLVPAVIISKYKPIEVIREKNRNMGSHSLFRNTLVSMQFVVFIVLISGTITIGKQLYFLRNHQAGFSKENVLVIENGNKVGQSSGVLKNELIKNPNVTDACFASDLPSRFEGGSTSFSKPNDDRKILINKIYVDGDFLNTLKIKLAEGRFLTNNTNEETDNAVINRKAAELLGWTDCNNKIIFDYDNGGKNFNVVGIVEDFHLGSLKFEQQPVIIRIADRAKFLALRVRAGRERSVVEFAKTKWEKLNTVVPFEYFFLDNSFNAQYISEERLSKLVSLFSTVSAIIACMGLLGLVSFASVRRRKEIGIRKVNGATISEVLSMLNKDFVKWVAIAFVIATPIAYYAMNKWLENFAYKTELNWWIFALAGLLALGIALLTVSWQSWRAATQNPVEALRYE